MTGRAGSTLKSAGSAKSAKSLAGQPLSSRRGAGKTPRIAAALLQGQGKIRKTMEIDAEKLARARQILGSASDTQTVDRALEIIVANQEIRAAIENAYGSMPDFKLLR